MIVRRLLQLLSHPFSAMFVAAPLGAFFALLAVNALAVIAGHLGMTAIHDILRDVGVNTGPLALGGGLGAGIGAAAGGGKPIFPPDSPFAPDKGGFPPWAGPPRSAQDPATRPSPLQDSWGVWFTQGVQHMAAHIVGPPQESAGSPASVAGKA